MERISLHGVATSVLGRHLHTSEIGEVLVIGVRMCPLPERVPDVWILTAGDLPEYRLAESGERVPPSS